MWKQSKGDTRRYYALIPLNEPIFSLLMVGSFRGINGEIYKSSFV